MNMLQTHKKVDAIERSRDAILNLGYDYIEFKSKSKKSLTRFKKQITSFHL